VAGRKRRAAADAGELLKRLQDLVYDFHTIGRFGEARPHLIWLMEIAERETPGGAAQR
jgi:hypothetical protein